MNVLISSAGRRNYLVDYFRHALRGRARILAADMSPQAPALGAADAGFVIPSAADERHTDALVQVCQQQDVQLLFSVNDLELLTLAEHKDLFGSIGTHVLVSGPEVVRVCLDKLETDAFLNRHGISSPLTLEAGMDGLVDALPEGLSYPLIVKHRFGSASSGLDVVRDRSELEAVLALAHSRSRWAVDEAVEDGRPELVIQPYLSGEEYGLDIMNDLEGRYVATAVKRKLSMRAGETDQAITVADAGLEQLGERIGRSLGHVGVLDCDVMVSEGVPYVIDLNPRFGGGYPFSHAAGVDMPSAILAWLEGTAPDPDWLVCRADVTGAKYDMLLSPSVVDTQTWPPSS